MKKRFLVGLLCLLLICTLCFRKHTVDSNIVSSTNAHDRFYIVIDPGHGGFDGGAVAFDGTIEKDLNLSISLKLDGILRCLGFDTVLIRSEDVSVEDVGSGSKKVSDIKNRLKVMGKYKDCIYVSIHMNKYSTTQPHGAQVFYSKFGDSKLLADSIQKSITENLQTDNKRVTKSSTKDIYILHNAVAPAVITECGFLSNRTDLENLKNSDYQLKMAFSIAIGIVNYTQSK